MNLRFSILFLCGLLFVSCEFFQKKELSNDIAVDTIIDFNSVDIFPLFPKCDSIVSQNDQKICSQIKLSQHINASLSSTQIITSKKINDTIFIKLIIDKTGKIILNDIQSSEFIQQQIPKLDSLITNGIDSLPQLKPAIKRGMPVTTQFTLPIVIKNY